MQRLLAADDEAKKNIMQEINILKKLAGHPNIIQYLAASFIDRNPTVGGQSEYLLVTELCTGMRKLKQSYCLDIYFIPSVEKCRFKFFYCPKKCKLKK